MPCVKDKGKSDATDPRDITRLFNYLKIKNNATFCDLGCGNAKLCIKAITRVNQAIGIECDKKRFLSSKSKTKKYNKIKIYKGSYYHKRILEKIRNTSVFFCVNEIDTEFLDKLEQHVKHETFYIQYYFPPCPFMPNYKLGWYYILKTPFKKARTKKEWVRSLKQGNLIQLKRKIHSVFKNNKNIVQEFEDELKNQFP